MPPAKRPTTWISPAAAAHAGRDYSDASYHREARAAHYPGKERPHQETCRCPWCLAWLDLAGREMLGTTEWLG